MKQVTGYRVRRKRRVKVVFMVLASAAVILFLGMLAVIPPLIMGPMINKHVDFSKVYQAEEFDLKAQELTLLTEDGLAISAFEVMVEDPKGVLIFISGIHNPSVTALFGHARFLKEHGYASLLYDMRGHGDSDGGQVCLGFLEPRDTRAVVDYILSQPRYKDVPIIVYGFSMGGAVAINSIGQIPEIDGLISAAAYSSWEDVFTDNMASSGVPGWFAALERPFVKFYSLMKFGWETRHSYPSRQIENLGNRPALLMHSIEDSQVPYANFARLAARAPGHVQYWTRRGESHFVVADLFAPEEDEEYIERVLGFLGDNFN